MHIDQITNDIIRCAIGLHRTYGPGLLESVFQRCLGLDLTDLGYQVEIEQPIPLTYKGLELPKAFAVDIFVNRAVIVEVKCVREILDIHVAQVMTYLRLTNTRVGLILNFNVPVLKDGIRRVANDYRDGNGG